MLENNEVVEKKWVAIVRVGPQLPWYAYGPMTHKEALAFRHAKLGTGMECQLALLIPPPNEQLKRMGQWPIQPRPED